MEHCKGSENNANVNSCNEMTTLTPTSSFLLNSGYSQLVATVPNNG